MRQHRAGVRVGVRLYSGHGVGFTTHRHGRVSHGRWHFVEPVHLPPATDFRSESTLILAADCDNHAGRQRRGCLRLHGVPRPHIHNGARRDGVDPRRRIHRHFIVATTQWPQVSSGPHDSLDCSSVGRFLGRTRLDLSEQCIEQAARTKTERGRHCPVITHHLSREVEVRHSVVECLDPT